MLTKRELNRWMGEEKGAVLVPFSGRIPKLFLDEIKAISKREKVTPGVVLRRALSREFLARQQKGVSS